MPGKTEIQWTDASWNPVTGCTKVSAGCDHCYAETFAERFRGVPGHPYEQGFDLKLWPDRIEIPLHWKTPRRIFVNSMSDLFHADVPAEFIQSCFAVMAACPQHTFQVLTKRPQRMMRWVEHVGRDERFAAVGREALLAEAAQRAGIVWDGRGDDPINYRGVAGLGRIDNRRVAPQWPLPNVWLGTSVENQSAAYRIDFLVRTPAAVRFLSCEPLLGPLDLRAWLWEAAGLAWAGRNPSPNLGWVIAGGESGHGFRPLDLDWARSIRDQCGDAGVPFFWKQSAGRRPGAGRVLDGREWNQFPNGQGGIREEGDEGQSDARQTTMVLGVNR